MKTYTVKQPEQVFTGSFNPSTNLYKQFIPLPLKLADMNLPLELCSAAGDYHGSGIVLPWSHEGTTRHAILIEGESRYLPFGNWIIQYDYNQEDGIHSCQLYLAAEIC